jgi:small subunit ribosomal protein S14
MAKKSKIAKNERRREVVARYAARRAELKEILRRPSSTEAERAAAREEPRRRPRDASGTRVRNRDSVDDRDSVDGRPRGHLRTFGLSWVNLRGGQAHAGFLPGVRKSSW